MLFLEPNPTGERDRVGQAVYGDPHEHPVWCKRQDRGGSEGFVEENVVGGRWTRRYECWAEAFPAGRRPTTRWTVQGDDGVPLQIVSVTEMESGPHPVKLAVDCFWSAE